MTIATPALEGTYTTHMTCVHCGGQVRFDRPDPDTSDGTWVHVYAPEWGRMVICDPQKVREASR